MVQAECLLLLAILVRGAICQSTTSDAKKCEEGDSLQLSSIQQSLANIQRTISMKDFGSPRTSCPKGFNYSFDGIPKCYSVVTTVADWDTAKANCKKLHSKANLVSINSGLENQVLVDVLNGYKCLGVGDGGYDTDSFWTSGRRRSDSCSDTFVWIRDLENFQDLKAYTNWGYSEPGCTGNEYCLSIRKDSGTHGQWNDVKCSVSLCSVCELVTSASLET